MEISIADSFGGHILKHFLKMSSNTSKNAPKRLQKSGGIMNVYPVPVVGGIAGVHLLVFLHCPKDSMVGDTRIVVHSFPGCQGAKKNFFFQINIFDFLKIGL